MDILHLVDRLEELFNDSRAIPFTHNVVVDEDQMLAIIDQMRVAIPDEVKKAQQLLVQRDRIVAQAQEESGRIIKIAQDKAVELADRDSIAQMAQHRAEQIITKAQADAEKARADADNYVVDTLSNLELNLERTLTQVRNGIRVVQEEMMRQQMTGQPSETPSSSLPYGGPPADS
jgi:cell division septum initiation protein DivIVA